MSNIVRIKSDPCVPITMWGREGIIKSAHKDEVTIQFYDNSTFLTYKEYIEEVE